MPHWVEKLPSANAPKECYMPEKIIDRHLGEQLLAEMAVFYMRLRLTVTFQKQRTGGAVLRRAPSGS